MPDESATEPALRVGEGVPEARAEGAASASSWHEQGLRAYEASNWDEAARCWRRAIDADPAFARSYIGLGMLFMRRGEYVLAHAEFQTALGHDPAEVDALANLGALAVQRGEYPVAVGYYKRAVGVEPTDASLWVDLAISYAAAGDMPQAKTAALNALSFDGTSAEAKELLERLEHRMALEAITPPTTSGAAGIR